MRLAAPLLALLALPFAAAAAEVRVVLHGVSGTAGEVRAALYDAEGYARNAGPLARASATPTGAELALVFSDIAPGHYAVVVMHDENANGKLDATFLGIPSEPYGFSNNPTDWGRPKFEQVRFEVREETIELRIDLR